MKPRDQKKELEAAMKDAIAELKEKKMDMMRETTPQHMKEVRNLEKKVEEMSRVLRGLIEQEKIREEVNKRKQEEVVEQAFKTLESVANTPKKNNDKGKEEEGLNSVAKAVENNGDKKLAETLRSGKFDSEDVKRIDIPDASPAQLNVLQEVRQARVASNTNIISPTPEPTIPLQEKTQSGFLAVLANIGNAIQTGVRNIFNAIRDRIAGPKEAAPEMVSASDSHHDKSTYNAIMTQLNDDRLEIRTNIMLDTLYRDDSSIDLSKEANHLMKDIYTNENASDESMDESSEKFFHSEEEPAPKAKSNASEEASKMADDIYKDDSDSNDRKGPGLR